MATNKKDLHITVPRISNETIFGCCFEIWSVSLCSRYSEKDISPMQQQTYMMYLSSYKLFKPSAIFSFFLFFACTFHSMAVPIAFKTVIDKLITFQLRIQFSIHSCVNCFKVRLFYVLANILIPFGYQNLYLEMK